MSFRWTRPLFLLAAAALGVAVVALLKRPEPVPEPVIDATPPPVEPREPPRYPTEWEAAKVGGTYGGRVVGPDDRPVPGADVLLVAVDTTTTVAIDPLQAPGTGTVLAVPVVGGYLTAARTRTGPDGHFAVSAGDARVVAIVAYERAFAPGLLAHTSKQPLAPGDGHVIRLSPAGWLRGHVVDGATQAPIPGADVAIYFQTMANQEQPGPVPVTPTNSFARFQTYVAGVLGPMVWGVTPPPGDTGLHVTTDSDGTFSFGPVMSEVQVEVVVSHPDYMWTDPDPEVVFPQDNVKRDPTGKPLTRRRRTVVPAGETVEKTYALQKGKEVGGQVLDGEGKPIEGVEVALEHVAQYAQHAWYRTHTRTARTDKEGRFRIAGLSFEPYNLKFTHPSFDTEYVSGVKAGLDGVYRFESAGGWIEVTVEGGPSDDEPWAARAVAAPVEGHGTRREERLSVTAGHGVLERVRPGRYDLTLVSATQVSEATRVEVRSGESAQAVVRMTAGGGARIPVVDGAGQPLDPVTVELDSVAPEGVRRGAATLVARAGLAVASGLLPGRYRARARAPDYVTAESEPFDVASDATTTLPPLVLRRRAFLRVTGVVGEDGRPVAVDTQLYVAEGDGDFVAQRPLQLGVIPVRPGAVRLRAEASDHRRFEKSFTLQEGETLPVEVRLAP